MLLSHIDVVPADAKYWDVDPLSGAVKNGYIYGRGAIDTKGLGITQLQAFLALHASGKKLKRDVIFMATADEEAGGFFGAGWLVENRPEIFEGVGYLINEGGSGRITTGKPVFRVEVTQKVPLWLKLTALDTPGHGSSPRVTSSVTRILRAGHRIADTTFAYRVIPAVRTLFQSSAEFRSGELRTKFERIDESIKDPVFMTALQLREPGSVALLHNTCSITRLSGSNKINVVPPTASIELDFDSALSWLGKGAQPTSTAKGILSYTGVLMKKHLDGGVKKGAFTEEEAKKRFEKWMKEKSAKVEKKIEDVKAALESNKKEARDREEEYRKKKLKLSAVDALFYPMLNFLIGFSIIFVVWRGGILIQAGTASYGNIAEFIIYVIYLTWPVASLGYTLNLIQRSAASNKRIQDFLNEPLIIEDSDSVLSSLDQTEGIKGKIEFKNVSFKYEKEIVLKNLSFKIKKGQNIAIVGQSGSGKSTLANLVTRFYDVNNGSITIDGDDVKDISKKSLLGLMGIVTQDSILFNDSVSENIKLGKQDATAEEIRNASEIANAHEFVKELPKQYDTNIGDGGNKLSGGQKQRLSIARAVLKNPPIMILDEATSALDTESEQLVQIALEKMMKNRTSLVIAHRLSTIQNADNIVVMRKGSIVEQGKHDELLDKKGEYYKLVTMQTLQ